MQKTCIVVPCYNESRRLRKEEFTGFVRRQSDHCFIFVNDGSTDETGEILSDMSRECPGAIRNIHLECNMGKAEAVRRGIMDAITSGFEYIGYWDADLSTPIDIIPRFCAVLEDRRVDAVFGSRVRLLGRSIQRRPFRHYIGRLFATCASLTVGLPVYDTQCGAKIFRNTERLRKVFHMPFRVRWTFDVEIMARFLLLERVYGGPRVRDCFVEYPLEQWNDIAGSKLKPLDFLVGAWEILVILHILKVQSSEQGFITRIRKAEESAPVK